MVKVGDLCRFYGVWTFCPDKSLQYTGKEQFITDALGLVVSLTRFNTNCRLGVLIKDSLLYIDVPNTVLDFNMIKVLQQS